MLSAATMADASMVAEWRGVGAEMAGLVDGFRLEIAALPPAW